MEGAGSRLGRAASSRPLPPPSKLFSGRVRKWKKKWVHVSTPHNKQHSRSHFKPSCLSLCRWTPVSDEEQPRLRKLRYAPIVVLDSQMKEPGEEFGDGAKTIEAYQYQSTAFPTFRSDDAIHEKHVIAEISMKGDTHQESNQGLIARQTSQRSHFDIDLFFTPNSDDYNSLGEL